MFQCAVDGHCFPTMHCTKEMEELWMVVKQLHEHIRKQVDYKSQLD